MRIREHKGSYEESMATTAEIEPTREAIAKHIGVNPDIVSVDPRNGWHTHTVHVHNYSWGFTDSPLDPVKCPRCGKSHNHPPASTASRNSPTHTSGTPSMPQKHTGTTRTPTPNYSHTN